MSAGSHSSASQALLLVERACGSLAAVRQACPGSPVLTLLSSEGQGAADLISREKPAVVFCDHSHADPAGLELLGQIRRIHPDLPVIMVADAPDVTLAIEVFRRGADDLLSHPLDTGDIVQALSRVSLKNKTHVEVRAQRQVAERALDDLVLLRSIGETASSADDLSLLLDQIVQAIQTALQVEIVSLMLCDDAGRLEIRASRGLPAAAVAEVRIAPGDGVAGHVLAHGETVLIEDLASDGRFPLRGDVSRYRTGSLLSVPIRSHDGVTGVLNVNNKQDGRPFTAVDQRLLQTIAHQAALAIENHKLVSRLRLKSQELERTHRELYKIHQDRTRFVCNLSHELKTPLTSVLGFADLLVNFYDQIDTERVGEYLQGIYQEALHLEKLLSGILRLFAIDSGSENWHWQELDLVAAMVDSLQVHELGQAELNLAVEYQLPDDLAPVWGDPDKLALMLDALFDNAVKFNRPEGSIRIRAENRLHNDQPMVYFSVTNAGASVPPESAEEIFQQYSQLGGLDAGKPSGIGIGLATCRAILRQMHGDIYLEPIAGEGTCLGILLPTKAAYEELKHGHTRI